MFAFKVKITETRMARRIRDLPEMGTTMIESCAKGEAQALCAMFHDGIKNDEFGLFPLKEATIARKDALGMEQPDTPLYGLGDESDNSYANMMEVVKDETNKKYIVKPKDEYHEVLLPDGSVKKSEIKLEELFMVHEYGCTIANGFGKGILIRIPPRPAMRYAYEKVLSFIKKKDPAREVRAAISEYVRSGRKKAMKMIADKDWASEIVGRLVKKPRKGKGGDR